MTENKAKLLEARGGIEPPNKGFADLCLTTWLPRLRAMYLSYIRQNKTSNVCVYSSTG